MNSVSWFLYWIEVINSLGVVLTVAAVCSLVFAILYFLFSSITLDMESETTAEKIRARRSGVMWRLIPIGAVCGVIACFFPSKGTLYAMAASEVGGRVIQSEQVRGIADDATKALHQWIKKQIEPEAKK